MEVTTSQYRWIVIGQIAAMCALGLASLMIILGAAPACRARWHLDDAIGYYSVGAGSEVRRADESLDRALAVAPDMPLALALRGRIGVEQGNLSVAYDAYERLEKVLSAEGRPTGPALNGMGCVKRLRAGRPGENRAQLMKEAYSNFQAAVQQDDSDGDAHVNAAICRLYMGDLPGAASHLAAARGTRNLGYESLVGYYSAMGSMFAAASGKGPKAVAAVARAFDDPDRKLAENGRMLLRAAVELDKAYKLARGKRAVAVLQVSAAFVKATILAAPRSLLPLARTRSYEYWEDVSKALRQQADLLRQAEWRAKRRRLRVILAVSSYTRLGTARRALSSARRILREGELGAQERFYLGSLFFQLAQVKKKGAAERDSLEGSGTKLLLVALKEQKLPRRLQFCALGQVATSQWRAGDRSGAYDRMNKAARMLDDMGPGVLTRKQRGQFYRNLGIILYQSRKAGQAIKCIERSLMADSAQNDVRRFQRSMNERPLVGDIRAIPAEKLPPSMPIVTARVTNRGLVAARQEDVEVYIGGKRVTMVMWGEKARLYALAQHAMPDGKTYRVRIIITLAGKKKAVEAQKTLRVTYK